MMLLAFAGLGFVGYRRKRGRRAMILATPRLAGVGVM
jgi:hypothetical protein